MIHSDKFKDIKVALAEKEAADQAFRETLEGDPEAESIAKAAHHIRKLKIAYPKLMIPPKGGRCPICETYKDNDMRWRVNIKLREDPVITCYSCSNVGTSDSEAITLPELNRELGVIPVKLIMSREGMDSLLSRSGITVKNFASVACIPYSSFRYKLESSGFTTKEYSQIIAAFRLIGMIDAPDGD